MTPTHAMLQGNIAAAQLRSLARIAGLPELRIATRDVKFELR
jgi:hypothetical protein